MRTETVLKNYEFYAQADLSKYAGEWVAIINSQIVAHGKNLKEILTKAKQANPDLTPFITKVPAKKNLLW